MHVFSISFMVKDKIVNFHAKDGWMVLSYLTSQRQFLEPIKIRDTDIAAFKNKKTKKKHVVLLEYTTYVKVGRSLYLALNRMN